VVQYKAVSKTLNANQLADLFEQNVAEFRANITRSIAEVIAQTSPVDTGTYAESHRVRLRSGSAQPTKTSHGKPRKVDPTGPRRTGKDNMLADISAIDNMKESVVFYNEAIHAVYVEREHQVYARARREINTLVNETAARLGMKTK
jgi:hypothetical protein